MRFSRHIILLPVLGLAACAAPKGESWPTVSFGDDVAAINDAIEGPSSVTLAPLPGLTADEQADAGNPQNYFTSARQDFFTLKENLTNRRTDYAAAQAAYRSASGDSANQAWLTAQMELSNISQATEAIKVIRARLALIEVDIPAAADFILAAEQLELEYRAFILEERITLAETRP